MLSALLTDQESVVSVLVLNFQLDKDVAVAVVVEVSAAEVVAEETDRHTEETVDVPVHALVIVDVIAAATEAVIAVVTEAEIAVVNAVAKENVLVQDLDLLKNVIVLTRRVAPALEAVLAAVLLLRTKLWKIQDHTVSSPQHQFATLIPPKNLESMI